MPKGKVYLDEKFIGISMDYYQIILLWENRLKRNKIVIKNV